MFEERKMEWIESWRARDSKINWSTTSALNLRIMQYVTWFSRNAWYKFNYYSRWEGRNDANPVRATSKTFNLVLNRLRNCVCAYTCFHLRKFTVLVREVEAQTSKEFCTYWVVEYRIDTRVWKRDNSNESYLFILLSDSIIFLIRMFHPIVVEMKLDNS